MLILAGSTGATNTQLIRGVFMDFGVVGPRRGGFVSKVGSEMKWKIMTLSEMFLRVGVHIEFPQCLRLFGHLMLLCRCPHIDYFSLEQASSSIDASAWSSRLAPVSRTSTRNSREQTCSYGHNSSH